MTNVKTKVRQLLIRVPMFDFNRELADKVSKAGIALRNAENELLSAFAKSDRYLAAKDLANGDANFKSMIGPKLEGSMIVAGAHVGEILEDEAATSPIVPLPYIDPKQFNQLMNGSILTPEEKREMLKRMNIIIEKPST